MIINQTDSETLIKMRAILVEDHDHRSNNRQTLHALRMKIGAIDYTLTEREKETA